MDMVSVLNMDGVHTTVGPNKHQAVMYHGTLHNGYSIYDDERKSNFAYSCCALFHMMLLLVLYEAVPVVLEQFVIMLHI